MALDPIAIFEDLKQKIIWLDITPGTALNLVELADRYQVSRTPIAIALARLDAEEWVSRHGSHYVVSLLTVEQMRDITELRTVLEQDAASWAYERMTQQGFQDLAELRRRIQSLPEGASNLDIVRLDYDFHQIIYRETQNRCLVKIIQKMLCHYLRFWLTKPNPINPAVFFQDTLEVIDAMEQRRPEVVETAIFRHVRSSLDEIMRF